MKNMFVLDLDLSHVIKEDEFDPVELPEVDVEVSFQQVEAGLD